MRVLKISFICSLTGLLLQGCVSLGPVSTAQDMRGSVQIVQGVDGCNGCDSIRTFTSGSVTNGLYAIKDENNHNTGERVAASLSFGASNRPAGLKGGFSNDPVALRYVSEMAQPQAHLFEGRVKTDANHPYRFFVRIHHNSSNLDQAVFVVDELGKFSPLRPVRFDGIENKVSCFASGCVWDEDYVVSAKVVEELIAKEQTVKIFVGKRVSRQVQSADGLNAAFSIQDQGVLLSTRADLVGAFLDTVQKNLGL